MFSSSLSNHAFLTSCKHVWLQVYERQSFFASRLAASEWCFRETGISFSWDINVRFLGRGKSCGCFHMPTYFWNHQSRFPSNPWEISLFREQIDYTHLFDYIFHIIGTRNRKFWNVQMYFSVTNNTNRDKSWSRQHSPMASVYWHFTFVFLNVYSVQIALLIRLAT